MNLLLFIVVAVGCYLYFHFAKQAKGRKRDWNAQLKWQAQQQLPRILLANEHFKSLIECSSGYFSNYLLQKWREDFQTLYNSSEAISYNEIGLSFDEASAFETFLYNYKNADSLRKLANQQFIKKELNDFSTFFDNIENRKLDIQQRTAIVTEEDNNLVVAGAGSGKTTTIVGKVGYLVKRFNILPKEILLVSFTNKSATSLADRINIPGVEAKTFHKFGKEVIVDVENKQPSIFEEAQFTQLITGVFQELCKNPSYLSKVTSYFSNYLKPFKAQDEFKNQGEYIQYLKDQNFSTYKIKSKENSARITYKREVVKSIEECKIANFLLFNGIEYEYERPYEHDTTSKERRQYKPDFALSFNKKVFYLEHFGIDKNGKVPHFFADKEKGKTLEDASQEYNDGIIWKRGLHQQHGTTLIESYSHEMPEDLELGVLSKKLTAAGIILNPKGSDEIWHIISEAAKDEVDGFIKLIQTFITLLKSNNLLLSEIAHQNQQERDRFQRERNALFIELMQPIVEKYQAVLADRKEIDFSDMINKATSYVASGQLKRSYKYIVIDEFQDLSIGRYKLLKALKDANPGCKLFCVGDDWQSIYRFSGSDMALFKDFEKYFGVSVTSKIETTYRFGNPIISQSGDFILKNPNQTKKELRSFNVKKETSYEVVYNENESQDDTDSLKGLFDKILAHDNGEAKEVLILGRYSFDINRVKNYDNGFMIDRNHDTILYAKQDQQAQLRKISAKFMTVHKSKGLEADYVIVLNCNSGKRGFPSNMSDDPVLNLLLSNADQFENGEERRLFYVAMTRAKEKVFFIADRLFKSKFIVELEGKTVNLRIKRCPRCNDAELVEKSGVTNGKKWAFYACSNFVYGCDYKRWIVAGI